LQLDLVCALIGPFRWRAALVAEIFVLRHQLNVLQRKSPKRLTFSSIERLFLLELVVWRPGFRRSEDYEAGNIAAGARAGFRAYWRWNFLTAPGPADDTSGHSPLHSRKGCRKSAGRRFGRSPSLFGVCCSITTVSSADSDTSIF
jgi:hypothetical protein